MARERSNNNGVTLDFEAKLWQAADALRNNMDAAEYKHVVLGLIFLKYISDAFEAKHAELDAQRGEGADPEDPDEYRAENIFWVPPEARWSHLKGAAPQPTIGQIVDDAMAAIERDNHSLKSVLPKDYARPGLDKQRLGALIDLTERQWDAVVDLNLKWTFFAAQAAARAMANGGSIINVSSRSGSHRASRG